MCTAAPWSLGPFRLRDEVVPGGQLTTDLALRQLQKKRGDRFMDRLQVGQVISCVGSPTFKPTSPWRR